MAKGLREQLIGAWKLSYEERPIDGSPSFYPMDESSLLSCPTGWGLLYSGKDRSHRSFSGGSGPKQIKRDTDPWAARKQEAAGRRQDAVQLCKAAS